MVTLEPVKLEKKSHQRVKNKDLPTELLENKQFCKKIMPVLYQWAAAMKDPWFITSEALTNAVKVVVQSYLGDDYEPNENSPEVIKVSTIQLFNYIPFHSPLPLCRRISISVTGGGSIFNTALFSHS